MRLDRLLTLYFFHPLSRMLRRNSGTRISILMYHSILDQDDPNRHPYFQTNTKPEIFAQQMQFLADNNYNVISLSEAISLIGGSPQLPNQLNNSVTAAKQPIPQLPNYSITSPRKYVVLTWDDGYRDFHDNAWPILKKHGFTATMFLPTGYISNDRKSLIGKNCLTWDEVTTLAGEGASFGAHTVSHVQLYELYKTASKQSNMSFLRRQESIETMATIDYELRASKQAIEEKLGRPVDQYSYAYAFPEQDQKFVDIYGKALKREGYRSAVSTRIGTAKRGDSLYTLKRIPVNSHDDDGFLQAKLEGGYDWLHQLQSAKKKMRFAG